MSTKPPDEIKNGILMCSKSTNAMECECCPYRPYKLCVNKMAAYALALIQQLQADNAQLNRCIENMTDKLNAANDSLPRWISVEERLPEYDEEVLLSEKVGKYTMLTVGYLGEDGCFYTGAGCPYVTHWMPLSEPPKEPEA